METDWLAENTGLFVAIVGASLFVLAALLLLFYCCCCGQSAEAEDDTGLSGQQELEGDIPLVPLTLIDRLRGKGWQDHRLVRRSRSDVIWI